MGLDRWVSLRSTHPTRSTHPPRCPAAEDGQQAKASAGHQGAKAKPSDLEGMDSINAVDVMTARGFKGVDTLDRDDVLYGIDDNPRTRQCVQLANTHDRVDSAVDIHTHPKCC